MQNESSQPDPRTLRASDAERERVATILHDALSQGRLTVAELDERLQTTYAAKTLGELEPVTADLPVPAPLPVATQPTAAGTRVGGTPSGASSIAVLGGADRRGVWVVPARYTVVAIMGGSDLDLSEARLASRETVITVFAFWGGVDIVVPDDVDVRVEGIGILGDFDNKIHDHAPPQGAPVVRVTGVAIMAGVDIKRPKRRQHGS